MGVPQLLRNGKNAKEPVLCKSILYEFAVKKNLNRPVYYTRNAQGPSSVYICHMVLADKTYKGEVTGSKKMAEQLAARTAIESLREQLFASKLMAQLVILEGDQSVKQKPTTGEGTK
ncbi:hypothetical protein RND71_029364 [Anisodus tanguticus]|uniref:DRBM domain-containing protein n=1 Tax=Anisodus tanguticus TaxID=243964 RepID=A0AAE1V4I4_9SOLA|nr:hypothetical protein RND71_029364 [Anisodus tanguticus]